MTCSNMRYYQMNYSTNKKEIGDFPQSQTMSKGYNYGAPNSVYNLDYWRKITIEPSLDAFELSKKAKILDYMSAVTISFGLIITDRFRKVLSGFNCDPDYQVFDLKFVRGIDSWNYIYYFNYSIRTEYISFKDMSFFETSIIGTDPKPININSFEQFKNYNIPVNKSIMPDQLILENPEYDLFRLSNPALGYYVSERLMNAIKEAGMTGIDFKPIDELVFLR